MDFVRHDGNDMTRIPSRDVRTELLSVFSEISQRVPYLRLGQLLAILADRAELPYDNPVLEAEDNELLSPAREYLEEVKALPEEYLDEQIRVHRESRRPSQMTIEASNATRSLECES